MTSRPDVRFDALVADARIAAERILPFVRRTPLESSPVLSDRTGADVLLKLENLQHTGSFKLRGAANKLLTLPPNEHVGVVTASSGNHGLGVAYAGQALGIPVVVFVPAGASSAKVDAIRRLGAEVRTFGTDGLESELHAREVARDTGSAYVSPYNDPAVIAGQATVGLEILEQAQGGIDAVIIAVGGGGLIGGTAAVLRDALPNVTVIGAQPERSSVMMSSVKAGRMLELPSQPTLSDGTAGGVELDSITFELCQSLVDEWVAVSEGQIASAMRTMAEAHHFIVEGAAGVALAALESSSRDLKGQRVAIVICGANVSAAVARSVLCEASS